MNKRRKRTHIDRLAKGLTVDGKAAFSIGGTGASLTKKDKIDVEMGFEYRKRLKVAPVRGVKQLTEEEFKAKLKAGKTKKPRFAETEEIPMTKAEFLAKLNDGDFLTRKGRRTANERKVAAMRYLEGIEERWWTQQQLSLLFTFDIKEYKERTRLYNEWSKEMAPKVVRAIQFLIDNGKAKEAKELEEYFIGLLEANKPKRPVLAGLKYQVRKLTLNNDTMNLRQLYEEMAPLLKALEEQ